MSTFNDEDYIEEFKSMVQGLNIKTALEIGYGSSELVEALRSIGIGAEGIDQSTELSQGKQEPYLHNVSLTDFNPDKKYELVYSSGVLEHYEPGQLSDILGKITSLSSKYIFNLVPNTNCLAYKKAKARTEASWKDESDFTREGLAQIHEAAGLKLIQTGTAGREWTKRFGPEWNGEPYLVYCIAVVQSPTEIDT